MVKRDILERERESDLTKDVFMLKDVKKSHIQRFKVLYHRPYHTEKKRQI